MKDNIEKLSSDFLPSYSLKYYDQILKGMMQVINAGYSNTGLSMDNLMVSWSTVAIIDLGHLVKIGDKIPITVQSLQSDQ